MAPTGYGGERSLEVDLHRFCAKKGYQWSEVALGEFGSKAYTVQSEDNLVIDNIEVPHSECREDLPPGRAMGARVLRNQIGTRSLREHLPPARADVLSSKNTRGRLEAFLHPTFQGSFSSEALIGDTPLGIRGYAENPSGNDRKRNP